MSRLTLLDKVWDAHTVRVLPNGMTQLLVGLHLIHEVTSPQAFGMLRGRGMRVKFPRRTVATVDHIVPTDMRTRPLRDPEAEAMLQAIEANTQEFGLTFFNMDDDRQGIVHVIGPELGLTRPGMVIACGDSHTSTHGAFGSVAFGIGTTQVFNVLATGCLLYKKPWVRRISITGSLPLGVTAKDVILAIIGKLGVGGGTGYAYEYAGEAIHALNMEERMTICNMSIEGGAVCGYVNPDQVTYDYLRGRRYAPNVMFDEHARYWGSFASHPEAEYDDDVTIPGESLEPMVTWGINPGQVIGVSQRIPEDADGEALAYMGLSAGQPIAGTQIDVAFIGSCTNSRSTDLRRAAALIKRHNLKVAPGVRAIVVPGSALVRKQAEDEGLPDVFRSAGFDFRAAGCSMCLAMNPDRLNGREMCASSSNRNFKGRQGSKTGRTLLMSPEMVVAAAATGVVTDVRQLLN